MPEIKKKILIVEDDLALAGVLANKLGLMSYETAMASDGQAAMDRINSDHYDLITLDLAMPLVDGFQVLEQLQQAKNKTPVVVLSNLADIKSINKAKELGAIDYLVKTSVTPDMIAKEIGKHLS